MNFLIHFEINNSNDAEALAALEWLANNYGNQIPQAYFITENKTVKGSITETTFNNSVTIIQALKSQFTVRIIKYDLQTVIE